MWSTFRYVTTTTGTPGASSWELQVPVKLEPYFLFEFIFFSPITQGNNIVQPSFCTLYVCFILKKFHFFEKTCYEYWCLVRAPPLGGCPIVITLSVCLPVCLSVRQKTLILAITSLLLGKGLSYLACVFLMTRPFQTYRKFRTRGP